MAKYLAILLIFLSAFGCQKEVTSIKKYELTNHEVYIDVVKKNIN